MYTTKPYKAYNSLLQTSTIWGTACMACMAYPQIKWLLGLCWSQSLGSPVRWHHNSRRQRKNSESGTWLGENVGPRHYIHYLGDVGCPRFILKTHVLYTNWKVSLCLPSIKPFHIVSWPSRSHHGTMMPHHSAVPTFLQFNQCEIHLK